MRGDRLDEHSTPIDAKPSARSVVLVRRWHAEKAHGVAALHDMDIVRAISRKLPCWRGGPAAMGATAEVLTADNLLEARRMCEKPSTTALARLRRGPICRFAGA